MKGLILSGGKGTRLYPLTYTRAKQLIPVANKPILFRVIESIRNAGIREIGIVIGSTGEEIRGAVGNGEQFGDVEITYIPQESPDGLAHAVKISQDFLQDDDFVMFLGDNVIQGGINQLVEEFTQHAWTSQIVLKEVLDPRAYGVAKLREDGSVEYLVEKPKEPPSKLALVGIYMFDHHIFEAVHAIKPSKRGELEITDAIQWLAENGYTIYPHIHQGWWVDTGKPTDMLEANSLVMEEILSEMAEAERVSPSAVINHNSMIDHRVIVSEGALITDSIVRGPATIGAHARIENSYVGPYTSIDKNVTIRNCEVERSIILEESTLEDLPTRLQDSLIGRKATVKRGTEKPRALKMNLGDYSNIQII
ncbi:MAG UNVERIFIED_CONTAM: glucose-1-phosphate thymidylyltransferase [Anaerolineae bacterium]|jgi:glucose-1-phosphate thymidylyltransferase